MLTAKGEEDNKIQGLEVGADDYITKPFRRARAGRPAQGRAAAHRAEAMARRRSKSAACCSTRSATASPSTASRAEMGPTEYRLLQFFMTHQERAYTRGQLLDQVWGGNVMSRSAPSTCISAACARSPARPTKIWCRRCAAPVIVSPPRLNSRTGVKR